MWNCKVINNNTFGIEAEFLAINEDQKNEFIRANEKKYPNPGFEIKITPLKISVNVADFEGVTEKEKTTDFDVFFDDIDLENAAEKSDLWYAVLNGQSTSIFTVDDDESGLYLVDNPSSYYILRIASEAAKEQFFRSFRGYYGVPGDLDFETWYSLERLKEKED